MATKVFFRNAVASTHRGTNTAKLNGSTSGWVPKLLSTSAGAGVTAKTTNTVAGPTSGVEVTDTAGGNPLEWISEPIDADVTISGTITANIWVAESNMSANVAINVVIDKLAASDQAITQIVKSTRVTEEAITTRAGVSFTTGMTSGAYSGVSLNKGDRIRIRIFGDDVGATNQGSGFTFSVGYDGGTGGADGDTFVSFTETFGFQTTDPTGTTLYLLSDTSSLDSVSDTGYLTPGTVTNIDRAASPAWSGTGNITTSDDTYATCVLVGGGSDYLACANFGFTIPDGYYMRGFAVEVEGKTSAGTTPISLWLQGSDGNTFGGSLDNWFDLTTTDQTFVVDRQDLVANLTEAIVEDVDFGIRIWTTDADSVTVSIDRVRMKVYYSALPRARELWTNRGSGAHDLNSQNSGGGWMAPLQWQSGGGSITAWYSHQLQAFTLSGLVKFNLRAKDNDAATNGSLRATLSVVNSNGSLSSTWGTACVQAITTYGSPGELNTAETAYTAYVSGDDLSVTDGQRILVEIFGEDTASDPIATGNPQTLWVSGTSGGASGDTFLILPQSVTEFVAGLTEPLKLHLQAVNRSNVY